MSEPLQDGALVTAVVIGGRRRDLVAPILIHDGDYVIFRLKNGVPNLTITRVADIPCEITISRVSDIP